MWKVMLSVPLLCGQGVLRSGLDSFRVGFPSRQIGRRLAPK